jgi:membrane protein implicated in regulation of membrane protease activity
MLWQEWWVWIVGGIALAVLEVIAPGYILLGFAIGALAVGVLVGIGLLGSSLPVMILVLAVMSLVAWLAMRRILGLRTGQVKIWDRDINDN